MGLFSSGKWVSVDKIAMDDTIEITLTNGRVAKGKVVDMLYRQSSGQYFFRVAGETIFSRGYYTNERIKRF